MREMLEPIFGASGAIVAQFVITLAVVLALVAVVVWLVRRYAAGGLGPTSRSRLPRLAIVDAMAVDNRRKLVLVRRDNVEHLILIGGPADLVVEPGILRSRSTVSTSPRPATGMAAPAPKPAAKAAPPPPAPVAPPVATPAAARQAEPSGAEQPIPFPPRRAERSTLRREPLRPVAPLAPPPVADMPQHWPLRPLPSETEAEIATPPPSRPAPQVLTAALPPAPAAVNETSPAEFETIERAPVAATGEEVEAAAPGEEPAQPLAAGEPASDSPDGDSQVRMSDLERDMARLLGEIAGRRSS